MTVRLVLLIHLLLLLCISGIRSCLCLNRSGRRLELDRDLLLRIYVSLPRHCRLELTRVLLLLDCLSRLLLRRVLIRPHRLIGPFLVVGLLIVQFGLYLWPIRLLTTLL